MSGRFRERPHVGFYVHYHGRGHKHRTEAVLRSLRSDATVLCSRIADEPWSGPTLRRVIDLPCDIDGVPAEGDARREDLSAAHFTPLWTPNIASRVAKLAAWFESELPSCVVVDVSSEVALLCRLASIPTAVVRQHGDRRDPGHLSALESAGLLMAPFPEFLEDDLTPDWVREKTVYSAGFCRHTEVNPERSVSRRTLGWRDGTHVLFMTGAGGDGSSTDRVSEVATANPHTTWHAIGRFTPTGDEPANLDVIGWVEDPRPFVAAADVVVSAAGHNSVMELGRQRAKLILIPEPRPFEEQRRKAAVLSLAGLAVVREAWPEPSMWSALLDEAVSLKSDRWDAVFEGDGAATLAAAVDRYAEESDVVWAKSTVECE